ncbi:MAG: Hpt domain-containing protein [Cyclobacteriaceae bacterium]|nr:Hpt domain-containing protein [Cyclobacteriaceae bacterium SS2]
MKDLLVIYKKENDECMLRIQNALDSQDYDDIRAVAHKMKGSSRIIGAFAVEELANLIEKTLDDKEIQQKVTDLKNNYTLLIREIDSLLAR